MREDAGDTCHMAVRVRPWYERDGYWHCGRCGTANETEAWPDQCKYCRTLRDLRPNPGGA